MHPALTHPSRALTLIELLVVVAIIAVLAAIAVPNFLEAQTRAKVSRAQTDMRAIATGVEMYRIDRGRYPPDADQGEIVYLRRLLRLTTPVAYLTSVPADPFASRGRIIEYTSSKPHNPYAIPASSNNFVYPLTYDWASRRRADGTWESDATWARIASNPSTVQWGMRSAGPDTWPAWLGEEIAPYDPTNGTVSEGNIFWSGPGKGPDRPRDLP